MHPAGSVTGTQVTVSEGHPWNSRSKNSGDIGGDFFTQRLYVEGLTRPLTRAFAARDGSGVRFENTLYGPVYPCSPTGVATFPSSGHTGNNQLDEVGATAIARCKPTNSVADVATFLGELLTGGIPHLVGHQLWKDKVSSARKTASGEYLNFEFGVQPAINDIGKIINAVIRADTVLRQYERDAGRLVRRRYEFPTTRERIETVLGEDVQADMPGVSSDMQDRSKTRGRLVRVYEKTQRRWFSGAFTYHLPTGYDSRSAMARYALMADKVFGASLTPETIWNLAPWSWAVDWFSNTGDVISNLTSFANDGLVLHHGYVMEHTITKHTYVFSGRTGIKGVDAEPAPLSFVVETKIRRRANPFGFGLTWSGLSPRQLAIAAALGLSRR